MHTATTYLTATLLVLSSLALAAPTTAHGDCNHLHEDPQENDHCLPDDPGVCEDGSTCDQLRDEAEQCVNDRTYCDASLGTCGDDDLLVEVTTFGNTREECVRDEPVDPVVDEVLALPSTLVGLVEDVLQKCLDGLEPQPCQL